MGSRIIIRIEEHSDEKVVSFKSSKFGAEGEAIDMIHTWEVKNVNDYLICSLIGFALEGHYPQGEDDDEHIYVMQMFSFTDVSKENTFWGAEVVDAPKGLFLVGDVALNEFYNKRIP